MDTGTCHLVGLWKLNTAQLDYILLVAETESTWSLPGQQRGTSLASRFGQEYRISSGASLAAPGSQLKTQAREYGQGLMRW